MQSRINRFLLAYALLVSTLSAGALVTQAIGAQNKVAFDEIDVKRINVREEDGTLRLVISNTKRFPGVIVKGKEQPHPNRQTAGLLFFNEEGTENGGLTWDGSKRNGKVSSGGHLSFDRYEQDQVIQLTQSEQEDSRMAAMIMSDRPDQPMDFAGLAKVTALPAARAGGLAANSGSIRTTPVNQSAGPLAEGCELLGVIFIVRLLDLVD